MLCIAALAASASYVHAETGAAMSLSECVESALRNSENFKIAHEKSVESGIKVREAWGSLWPDLSTGFSATRVSATRG